MLRKIRLLAVAMLSLALMGVGLALAQEGDPERGVKLYAENCAVRVLGA